MKQYTPGDMDQPAGLRCRQSSLRGAVGGLILCAVPIGMAWLCWHRGGALAALGGCAVMAAVVRPLVFANVLAKFRPTNWLLWVAPDGLWINLRSYEARQFPEGVTILHLPYAEIASACRHVETWSTPSTSSPSTQWKQESLELHLASGDTREVAQALAEERGLKPPGPGGPGPSRGKTRSVTVPAPGVIRLAWRGPGHDVEPALDRVLDELSPYVQVADTIRTDRPDWRKLNETELDELIVQLVRSGERIEAIHLLVRCRACSTTEAHTFVEELDARI